MYQDDLTTEALRLRVELRDAPTRIEVAREKLTTHKAKFRQLQEQREEELARISKEVAETTVDGTLEGKKVYTNDTLRGAEIRSRLSASLTRLLASAETENAIADGIYESECYKFRALKYQTLLLTREIDLLTGKAD